MTTQPITITLEGQPQSKLRARAYLDKGCIHHVTPTKTRRYEEAIRFAAKRAMAGAPPIDGPCELTLRAVMQVPASWSKTRQAAALTGSIRPATKPDLDNVMKSWADGMNGVVFVDDALIVRATLEKVYGPCPLVVATVRAIDGA